MKIDIIDLLNNKANNKRVPKKIKYGDVIWEWNGSNYEDKTKGLDSCKRFLLGKHNLNILNCKAEIIEEKPKKIEKISLLENYEVRCGDRFNGGFVSDVLTMINQTNNEIKEKLNEVIDVVNSLSEKSDKSE